MLIFWILKRLNVSKDRRSSSRLHWESVGIGSHPQSSQFTLNLSFSQVTPSQFKTINKSVSVADLFEELFEVYVKIPLLIAIVPDLSLIHI